MRNEKLGRIIYPCQVIEANSNVFLFFEVLDFVNMSVARENYRRYKQGCQMLLLLLKI